MKLVYMSVCGNTLNRFSLASSVLWGLYIQGLPLFEKFKTDGMQGASVIQEKECDL